LLAQLIESGVAWAHSDPNHSGACARRERTGASQREKERLNPNMTEGCLDRIDAPDVNIAEKPQRQMKLRRTRPDDAAYRVGQSRELLAQVFRQRYRYKKARLGHGRSMSRISSRTRRLVKKTQEERRGLLNAK
jgi:hypothetical protein